MCRPAMLLDAGCEVCRCHPRQLPGLHLHPAVAGLRLCDRHLPLRLVGLGLLIRRQPLTAALLRALLLFTGCYSCVLELCVQLVALQIPCGTSLGCYLCKNMLLHAKRQKWRQRHQPYLMIRQGDGPWAAWVKRASVAATVSILKGWREGILSWERRREFSRRLSWVWE